MGIERLSDEDYEATGGAVRFDNIDFDEEPANESEDEDGNLKRQSTADRGVRLHSASMPKVDVRQIELAGPSPSLSKLETNDMESAGKLQSRQRSGGRKGIFDIEEMNKKISDLLGRMEIAAQNDFRSNEDAKPAIEKLKLLPEVEEMCIQRELQPLLLSDGILGVLKSWIEPLPDGSLPNIRIRTSVLKILQKLPIDTAEQGDRTNLKMSQIGSRVMLLSRVSQETKENRKMARDLVQRWCRPIYEQARRDDDEDRIQDALSARKRRIEADRVEEERKKILKPGDPDFNPFARRPNPSRLDYVVKPPSRVDPNMLSGQKKNQVIQALGKMKRNRDQRK